MTTDTIGKKIKLLRKLKHWSQREVAKRLDISIPALSKIETGHTTLTFTRLKQIVDILETSIDDLTSTKTDRSYTDQLETAKNLQDKIAMREAEIAKLQRTAITLYEELRGK